MGRDYQLLGSAMVLLDCLEGCALRVYAWAAAAAVRSSLELSFAGMLLLLEQCCLCSLSPAAGQAPLAPFKAQISV